VSWFELSPVLAEFTSQEGQGQAKKAILTEQSADATDSLAHTYHPPYAENPRRRVSMVRTYESKALRSPSQDKAMGPASGAELERGGYEKMLSASTIDPLFDVVVP
jgi:hypothetical protein